ncbi:uncharacterized protein LOC131944716 [Physella acuta]|uniref:uncharacterized protein LOC131944716 n=1 Tax=Physella acuta TaxID=109671 RepID=UPI0027DC68BA|nr:uncharacterized protein LOC131944716 [Physella acuta]
MDGSIIDGDELPLVEIFTISNEKENRLDPNPQSFRAPDLTSVKKEIDSESEMNCDPDTNIVDNIATSSELVNKPENISVKKEIESESDTNMCVKKEIDPDSDPDIIW